MLLDTIWGAEHNLDSLDKERGSVKQQVWQLQDAKNKSSQVVEEAIKDGPQIITRHSTEVVVVLSYQEYRRMQLNRSKLSEFFRESPLPGVSLDLDRDKSGRRCDVEL